MPWGLHGLYMCVCKVCIGVVCILLSFVTISYTPFPQMYTNPVYKDPGTFYAKFEY